MFWQKYCPTMFLTMFWKSLNIVRMMHISDVFMFMILVFFVSLYFLNLLQQHFFRDLSPYRPCQELNIKQIEANVHRITLTFSNYVVWKSFNFGKSVPAGHTFQIAYGSKSCLSSYVLFIVWLSNPCLQRSWRLPVSSQNPLPSIEQIERVQFIKGGAIFHWLYSSGCC